MIQFTEDWSRHPGAQPDLLTANKTFVHMAKVYKKMGIKNHMFLLALVDQRLKDIDPYDPDITIEHQALVLNECKTNHWYFFREIVRAPTMVPGQILRFKANRGNIAVLWLYFNHIKSINIQNRQSGKSFTIQNLSNYLTGIRYTGKNINLLTKDDKLRTDTIKKIRELYATLPDWMQLTSKTDSRNNQTFTINKLKNALYTHLPSSSKKNAGNVGRGFTAPTNFIDEPAFQTWIGVSMPVLLASATAVRDQCEEDGDPYGTILTTTAGKLDDRDGKVIYTAVQNAAPWTESYFDCKDEKALESLIGNSCRTDDVAVNCTFNHRQLGYSDEWLRKAVAATGKSPTSLGIRRDYFNEWTSGTTSHPLDIDVLDTIKRSKTEPKFVDIPEGYGFAVNWYISRDKKEEFMLNNPNIFALDSSDAVGKDGMGFIVVDPYTGKTIMTCYVKKVNILSFTQWIFEMMVAYPKLVGIIERKSSGMSIMDQLLKMMHIRNINPFARLFNLVVNNRSQKPNDYDEAVEYAKYFNGNTYERHKEKFGFNTSAHGLASRDDLYGRTMTAATDTCGGTMYDHTLVSQISNIEIRNGRVDHKTGHNDDLLIAWLLVFFMITRASNLDYYGIDPSKLLKSVPRTKELVPSKRAEIVSGIQVRLRGRLNMLKKLHGKTKDPVIKDRCESSIRQLLKDIIPDNSEGNKFNLDNILNSMKDSRSIDRLKRKPRSLAEIHQRRIDLYL